MSSEEAKVAGLIESVKDGRFRLDQYLFGFHEDRHLRLQDLCNMLRSGSTNQSMSMDSFLSAHPERPLSLDELLNIFKGDLPVQGSIPRQSITSLRAKLSLLPTRHADRSGFLLHLGDALIRRFSQWAQKDDLEEAIWSYKEALSLVPNSHYYLESLLGLCSSLSQRYCLLGQADDLKNLLLYLDLQCDVLNRQHSLLSFVEVQLCPSSPILDVISIAYSRTFKHPLVQVPISVILAVILFLCRTVSDYYVPLKLTKRPDDVLIFFIAPGLIAILDGGINARKIFDDFYSLPTTIIALFLPRTRLLSTPTPKWKLRKRSKRDKKSAAVWDLGEKPLIISDTILGILFSLS